MAEPSRSYEELFRREQRFRSLLEQGHDLLFAIDESAQIVYMSRAAEAVLGRTPEQMVGHSALEFVDPADLSRAVSVLERIMRSPGETIEEGVRVLHADGSPRELRGRATNLLADPRVNAIVMALRDVTDEVRREAALRQSERRFLMLASRARDIIARYRILPEPMCEYISPSVERITGYTVEEYYADPYLHARMIHPDDRDRLGMLLQRKPDEMGIPITLRWLHKNGETVWIEQNLVPELDESGRVVAIESISRDVTEQVRLENDLRRAQKLDAVGRLAGGIAHDFNNLLGVTLLCAEQLKRSIGEGSTQRQWVEMILDSARRGSELAQQLLAFARREVSRDTPSDVHFVVRALKPMLERVLPEDVKLHIELSAQDAVIGLGQSAIEQVLMNLVVNARDAMPSGGTITLRSENRVAVTQAAVRSTTSVSQPRGFVLHVIDEGTGMSQDVLDHMFEPFFTTKAPNDGTGLGLSVVYGIVTQSGGHIAARSTLGAGTQLTLQWPCATLAPQSQSRAALEEPDTVPRGTETVLLVEDALLLQRLAADMLARLGYRVLTASTAAAALQRLEHAQASGQTIDLLLTDVVLPDESGVALVKRALRHAPLLHVVYTSGHAQEEMLRHGLPKGSSFLAKPFAEAELAHAVRDALDCRSAGESA